MRRGTLSLLLAGLLLVTAAAAEAQNDTPAPYTGRLHYTVKVLSAPENEAPVTGSISERYTVDILEILPDWLLIRANGLEGYVKRKAVNDTKVKVLDPANTPQYPAISSTFLGWVAIETSVLDAPNSINEPLITLQEGTRLAFVGIEDGWAKLIYHRQYGFVDTRNLSELQPVYELAGDADIGTPIAAFTSFYRTTTNETNIARMANISVANDRMRPLIVEPGGRFDFNAQVGPYRKSSGYFPAIVLVDGGTALGYGGGTCQVSSTLYNALLQLPGTEILQRRPHGPGGAPYLPLHSDAAVGNSALNLRFQNNYPFPIRIEGSAQDGALTIAIYKTR